jgi:hypothetical protein
MRQYWGNARRPLGRLKVVRHRQDMPYLRPLTAVVALVLAASPASAIDLHDYAVVKVHRGINHIDLGVRGQHATVVVGHRDNFNAHSVDVTSVYLSARSPAAGLGIVGVWNDLQESLYLTTSGGADCLLHDFRLLRSPTGAPPALVVADRPLRPGDTFGSNAPVAFEFYVLMHNDIGLPGQPAYWFKLVETRNTQAEYCDVGAALFRELGLPKYTVWSGP